MHRTNLRRVGAIVGVLGAALLLAACQPEGNLDTLRSEVSGAHLTGWARDPDTTEPIDIHVYVDGTFVMAARADLPRPDVQAARVDAGPAHGFSIDVPAAPGFHEVCVYGLDAAGGDDNAQIGCWPMRVPGADPAASPKFFPATVSVDDPCAPEDEGKYALTSEHMYVRCGTTLAAPTLHWYVV
jgi:hypothetical protein